MIRQGVTVYILRNRHSTYYSRIYFPKQLIECGCPRELRFSLRTKQRSVALDRSLIVLQCARSLIAAAGTTTNPVSLTRRIREQLTQIAKNNFKLPLQLSHPIKSAKKRPTINRPAQSTKQQDNFLNQFIEFKKLEGVKPKNVALLQSRVKVFVDTNTTSLECISTRDANNFLKSLYSKKLSLKTVREYLAAVKQSYNWLVVMEYVESNPFELIKVKADTRLASEQRRRWTSDELNRLFSHSNFVGIIGSNDSRVGYQKKLEDYWIPHLLLWTGARVSEICQLCTKDVIELNNVWCISINENDGKSVKTKASVRYVPLHKNLLNTGFLSYVNSRYEAHQEKLFSIKSYGKNECWSEQFSKRFAKVLSQLGFVGKDRPTLHGLRHSFIDAAQLAGIPENEVADIVGHTKPSMTYGRYGKRVDLERLQKAVNQIVI